jgi:hypothetical protein
MPQLLAAHHVPEAAIAGINSSSDVVQFLAIHIRSNARCLVQPPFLRTAFAGIASILVGVAVINRNSTLVLEAALVSAVAAAMLYTTADRSFGPHTSWGFGT